METIEVLPKAGIAATHTTSFRKAYMNRFLPLLTSIIAVTRSQNEASAARRQTFVLTQM